jgi:ATP-dependent Clp protease ATP-binding subunit ClpC
LSAVFERFTQQARQVVVLGQEEARALGHEHIGTEHLLLGLLREEAGVGARVLAALGVGIDDVRARIEAIAGRGDGSPQGQIPFTPRAKKVLELSLREALTLGQNYIGTEHVLLGLVREREGLAARVLGDLGVFPEQVREEVLRIVPQDRVETPGRRTFRRRGRVPVAAASPPRPRWQYRVEQRAALDDDAIAWLNELGAAGWELAGVVDRDEGLTLLFKRRTVDDVELRAAG